MFFVKDFMNKMHFLVGAALFLVNTSIVSMADMGFAFRYIAQAMAMKPSCRIAKDLESHGCIRKKNIEHVSHFIEDGHEYYCTQLSSDDWLVARKDIVGTSEGAVVCSRCFRTIAGVDWISLPVDKSIFSMLRERSMAISLERIGMH